MSASGRSGLLLDLDGTLVDTNYLHVLAWTRALRRNGHQVAMHRVHELVGMGGDRLIAALIGEPEPSIAEAWAEEFHHLQPEVRLLPGAGELVRELHRRHQLVVLASSAPARDVAAFEDLLDAHKWIEGSTSADDADASKPDPDIFEVAMDRFGLERASTLAVGDSVWDGRAAARAGIGFIGVESGGTDPEALADEGAIHVVRDAARLVELIDRIGIGGLRAT